MLTIRLFLVFQFLTLVLTAQQTIKIVNCWDEEEITVSDMRWYRNDSLVEELEFGFYTEHKISLPLGTYRVTYESFFQDTILEMVQVVSDTQTICFDGLRMKREKLPEIYWTDSADKNDTLKIKCVTTGCRMPEFHEELLMYRKNGKWYASYYEQEKTLTSEMIELFNSFEAQLRSIPNRRCTTISRYTVSFRDEELKIVDGSCSWRGFDNLLLTFGFEE